jgi:hypothetical protein
VTVYRVGEQGATVWSSDGRLLGSLPAGVTIVPAVEGVAPSPPAADPPDIPERVHDGKRVRGYADKAIRPTDREDKDI